MKKPPLFLLLSALFAVCASPAWAEKADRNKSMNIEAGTMRVDDVKQLTIFDDNVVLTKGTIVMRAGHIEVRQTPDGYQHGTITGTPDKPAFFRQKREAVDEFIEVESEHIDYDGSADVVKFTGNAKLRRLRGAVLADEISGALIVYENLTDKFSVDGNPGAAGGANKGSSGPASGTGRVRAILTPKPEAGSAAASQPGKAAAAAAASQPSPSLRATTTLGSPPQ